MIMLSSDRLRVEIAEPGEAPNDNRRFAHAGYVTEIVLDNKHRFGASEPHHLSHPSSGGRGLCCEYLFDLSGEAKVGEYYPKVGIGLLKKPDDEPYRIYRRYEMKPFPIHYTKTDSKAVFTVEPIPCMGYAFKHEKTVSVEGNAVTISERIENVGEKRFVGREYCHNMLTIDGLAIGPAYQMRLPDLTSRGKGLITGTIRGDGHGLTFTEYNHDPAFFAMDSADVTSKGSFKWVMRNTDASPDPEGAVSVECVEYMDACNLLFWAVDHLMSFEVHQEIDIAPGESKEWKRVWTFNA